MGEFGDLLAAVQSPPKGGAAPAGKFDDLTAAVKPPSHDIPVGVAAPAPQPTPSVMEAVNHGIAQGASFGLAATGAAAIDQLLAKTLPQTWRKHLQRFNEVGGSAGLPLDQDATFAERRAAYSGDINRSVQAHPVANAVGDVGGSLINPTAAIEEAIAKQTGKGLGAAIGTGALFGGERAAAAAGEANQSLPEAAMSTATGAALGGTGAALLHGAGKAAEKTSQALKDKYVRNFGAEVMGSTSKKGTVQAWANILGKEPESGVEERAAQKYVQSDEMQPVEAAARHHKYEDAIQEIDKNLGKYSPGRQANYGVVQDAENYQAGEGLAELNKSLFRARNQTKDHEAVKAIEKARDEWIQDYSSADSGAVQRMLLRPQAVSTQTADELRAVVDALPQSGRISRSDLATAVENTNAGHDAISFISDKVLNKDRGLLRWDPTVTIPALELRAQASARQASALQAFDKLSPQHSTATKTVVKKAIVSSLEKYLDRAAAKSDIADAAVRRIRNDDVNFSVLLAAKQGLKEALDKQQRNDLRTGPVLRGAAHAFGIGLGVNGATELPDDLKEGRYGRAALHGVEAAAGLGTLSSAVNRYSSIAHNRLGSALNKLSATQRGQNLLKAIQRRSPSATAGVATSTTLGAMNAQ